MKYYVIAGERSGDLHGGALVDHIKKIDHNSHIRCWGGNEMVEAGAELVVHYKETAFMGIWEVLKNYSKIKGFLKMCKEDIINWKPDVMIFIDYPGFNLRIAEFAKENGIKTCYYISPKVWAWNQKRAWKIKKYVDQMYCILPFEADFYKKFGYEVKFVGNPLTYSIKHHTTDERFILEHGSTKKMKVAVLPGSRYQEVSNMLKTISKLFPLFPEVEFYVARVDNLSSSLYERYVDYDNVKLFTNKAYDILKIADGAIVTSGTATLETALFKVPQVVCYKTSQLTYMVAKLLIKVKYISLVNLILDKLAVSELIQKEFNVNRLEVFLSDLLADDSSIQRMRADYDELFQVIGNENTPEITANYIVQFAKAQ